MGDNSYKLKLSLEQIIDLVAQLSEEGKERLNSEIKIANNKTTVQLNEEKVKSILRTVRPFLSHNLGKYTHQKSSLDWSFVGFAFTRKDLGYVFGMNVCFFGKDEANKFKYAGMNILIRTNGGDEPTRKKYLDFFTTYLKNWINQDKKTFTYPARGDEGVELAHYKKVIEFKNQYEVIDYIKDAIIEFKKIYPAVIDHTGLFENIVRAAPKWDEKFVSICKQFHT